MMQRADLEISGLRDEDVAQMAEIEKLSFSVPWSEQCIRDELDTPLSHYFIARKDGRVLGYIGTRILADECDITNIAVHPDFRRQGLAGILLSELLSFPAGKGVTAVMLEVRESNLPARAFYEKSGFEYCGRRKDYYEKPDEDALLMILYPEGKTC